MLYHVAVRRRNVCWAESRQWCGRSKRGNASRSAARPARSVARGAVVDNVDMESASVIDNSGTKSKNSYRIPVFRAALPYGSGADDDVRSYDLVWLIHLVGDAHQPLHATARFSKTFPDGDAGGNPVKIDCDTGV